MQMNQQNRRYRADIDGLRAFAVLAVILFHLKRAPFHGGFVGVDVFFVISGFLITGILVREMDERRFSLIRFYERRARRIAPALFGVIIGTLAIGYFVFLPVDLLSLGKSAIATIFMLANIFWWNDLDYFSAPPDTKPMLHMWSLGIEEQFYLFLPVILWGLTFNPLRRFRLQILLALLIVSMVACVVQTGNNASTAFFWLPFRAWELLMGGVLVFLPRSDKAPGWLVALLSCAGFIAIMAAILTFSKHTVFPGIHALVPVLGSVAVIWAGSGRNPATNRFLSWAPFVWIGLISYSLYLWHWPIIVFLRYWGMDELSHFGITVALVLTFSMATLSYGWIEQPFRNNKGFSQRQIFSWTVIGAALLTLWALGYIINQGFPQRVPESSKRFGEVTLEKQWDRWVPCFKGELPPELDLNGACHLGAKGKKPSFFLWGDSFGPSIAPGLSDFAAARDKAGLLVGIPACMPIAGLGTGASVSRKQCEYVQDNMMRAIDEIKPSTVIIVANWIGLNDKGPYDWVNAEWRGNYVDTAAGAFDKTIAEIRKRNVQVVIVSTIPSFEVDVPRVLARQVFYGNNPSLMLSLKDFNKQSIIPNRIFAKHRHEQGVIFVDPADVLCTKRGCKAQNDGRTLYYDSGHLSPYGSEFIAPIFKPVFDAAGPKK